MLKITRQKKNEGQIIQDILRKDNDLDDRENAISRGDMRGE